MSLTLEEIKQSEKELRDIYEKLGALRDFLTEDPAFNPVYLDRAMNATLEQIKIFK